MTLPYVTFYKPSLDNYIRNFVKYVKFEERERKREENLYDKNICTHWQTKNMIV